MDTLKIGYGRVDITPEDHVHLTGYGNDAVRLSEEFRDKIFATCLAFTDAQDHTVLLFTTDTMATYDGVTGPVRREIAAEFGLPFENVQVASTHTHSAPAITMKTPAMEAYREKYCEGLKEAARKAMADRTAGVIYIGNAYTDNMNFVRHYKMADGTFAGANFGSWAAGFAGHTSQPDTCLQAIKFVRPGAKDVVLVNFQAHPCFTGGIDKKVLSADYIGDLRSFVEEKTGAKFAFFQGAAGNHNGLSFDQRETRTRDSAEYGKLLGGYVLTALERLSSVTGDMTVAAVGRDMELELDHSDDHLVEKARQIQQIWRETYDRPRCNALAQEIGQNSVYALSHIIARAGRGETEVMPIYALKVGPLGFACAPYEMFGASGMHIKEWAPYAMTFVVSMCNDYRNYLATRLAFNHGCYEVDSRRYPAGTAELLADNFVEMLKELKK